MTRKTREKSAYAQQKECKAKTERVNAVRKERESCRLTKMMMTMMKKKRLMRGKEGQVVVCVV
jgi:hypothetical protein